MTASPAFILIKYLYEDSKQAASATQRQPAQQLSDSLFSEDTKLPDSASQQSQPPAIILVIIICGYQAISQRHPAPVQPAKPAAGNYLSQYYLKIPSRQPAPPSASRPSNYLSHYSLRIPSGQPVQPAKTSRQLFYS